MYNNLFENESYLLDHSQDFDGLYMWSMQKVYVKIKDKFRLSSARQLLERAIDTEILLESRLIVVNSSVWQNSGHKLCLTMAFFFFFF